MKVWEVRKYENQRPICDLYTPKQLWTSYRLKTSILLFGSCHPHIDGLKIRLMFDTVYLMKELSALFSSFNRIALL